MKFSRKNPSPKFVKLIEEYKLMHEKGYVQSNKLQKNLKIVMMENQPSGL